MAMRVSTRRALALFLGLIVLMTLLAGLDSLRKPALGFKTQMQCTSRDVSLNLPCLKAQVEQRMLPGQHVIIVQANIGFLEITMNLICSAEAAGLPRTRFLIWSMDQEMHLAATQAGLLSFYNPVLFYGTSQTVL